VKLVGFHACNVECVSSDYKRLKPTAKSSIANHTRHSIIGEQLQESDLSN
jgi:hypothetical protein